MAIVVAVVAPGGAGAFALTLGDKSDSGTRYHAILDPESDSSYQARLVKWRTALDDIDRAPFGHGLGTTGPVQVRYGEFRTIGADEVDNSYLKIAYEQGIVVMAFFMVTLLVLLTELIRHAVWTRAPGGALATTAAAGTLVAMLVEFLAGVHIDRLAILVGWVIVGLGIAHYATEREGAAGAAAA